MDLIVQGRFNQSLLNISLKLPRLFATYWRKVPILKLAIGRTAQPLSELQEKGAAKLLR